MRFVQLNNKQSMVFMNHEKNTSFKIQTQDHKIILNLYYEKNYPSLSFLV